MLFTPSPPLSSQSVSSSVESDLSPTHRTSICKEQNVENQLHTISLSNNPILPINGPLLPTNQSSLPQLSDQDFYHSPLSSSSSSSSRPSTHLTLPNFQSNQTHRRGSCPDSSIHKKLNPCLKPSIRDVLMATVPTPDSHMYHTEEKIAFSKANLWSDNNIIPVANPVAAAALVEDNEIVINEEQLTKSGNSSPIDTPKNSENIDQTSTICSANNYYSSPINTNRKVILNVGGVRHEGNLFIYLLCVFFSSYDRWISI
jgi:hypothetical protein